jgi:hypothetical protein
LFSCENVACGLKAAAETTESHMAKMRSPNFPAIHLSQAIDLVGKIFREDRTNAIEKEDAAKHMGYTGLTGRTLKLLGALSQFGLLEKVAKGQVRVSRTAVSILHPSNDEERIEAIGNAGHSPALFKRIRDAFPDDPSERTITSFLVREGFTDSAIPSVLKSYRETNRFLAAEGVTESHGIAGPEDADSFSNDDEDEGEMLQTPPPPAMPNPSAPAPDFSPPVQEGLSVNFDMKSVAITGRTTSPAELREFITALTALADLFDLLMTKIKDIRSPEEELDSADE